MSPCIDGLILTLKGSLAIATEMSEVETLTKRFMHDVMREYTRALVARKVEEVIQFPDRAMTVRYFTAP